MWRKNTGLQKKVSQTMRKSHNLLSRLPFSTSFSAFLWQFLHHISNSAIICLFRFMKYFVKALGVALHCNDLVHVANSMPLSLQTVQKLFSIANSDFESYVVCPLCQSVYHFEDCLICRPFGQSVAKSCCHIPYPRHPQLSRRSKCGAVTEKQVWSCHGEASVELSWRSKCGAVTEKQVWSCHREASVELSWRSKCGAVTEKQVWSCHREASVELSRRSKCGAVTEKQVWSCHGEASVELSRRSKCGAVTEKQVWSCHREASVELSQRSKCGAVTEKQVWSTTTKVG